MWKVGDKCECKLRSGYIIYDCEILELFPGKDYCKVSNLWSTSRWLMDFKDMRKPKILNRQRRRNLKS